jgi:hypothetical protein
VVLSGKTISGTHQTGAGQFFKDANGVDQPFNVVDPHYCVSPYTDAYAFVSGKFIDPTNKNFSFAEVSCVDAPLGVMVDNMMPTFNLYTTFWQAPTSL